MAKISRRKLARHVADHASSDAQLQQALKKVAALLIQEKRTHEADLIVRDIESALAVDGIVIADALSAHPLSTNELLGLKKSINADQVYIRQTVEPDLIGGLKLILPDAQYDATIRYRLSKLQSLKEN